ncbi:F-box protein [Corchorus olitorius]|uniref:F-box protein n=1 Tax=Corchorus olitorius TaxID=93759 RepID=A0A1R3HQM4_9ROSI|nr:F-box protein [Corchorus olitorius]
MEDTFSNDDIASEVLSRLPAKNTCILSCIHPGCFGDTSGLAKELVIYICNPLSKEWIALRPKRSDVSDTIGFAFDPFGSSLSPDPCFKLVSIHRTKRNANVYSFSVYTSEIGEWRPSKNVCHCNFTIRKNKMIFVKSRFYWSTWEHHIITFDDERKLYAVIKLPGLVMQLNGRGRGGLPSSF